MTASESEKSLVGQVIAGKYRVDSILGTGGMGVVLAATHLDLGRVVAVKLMRTDLSEHPWALDRLVREAKLAAQFRGEHVCRVLDVGTVEGGAPYIVMEYLEGSDLATLLAQFGHFEIETAVDFMLQASEAIAEAHAANIVHRDLKPENLFVARQLDGTPTIKVLDFGISKQVGAISTGGRSLTNPSSALGSPFYMAPEQMRSARDVDVRADLWAVGAILFELLTGRQAFQGESLPEVCAAVMSDVPPPVRQLRADVPEELSSAIARCLEKDPALRFGTILDLAIAIAPFGPSDAALSLERIERVLARRPGTSYPALNNSSLITRPNGVRLTPSGPRNRAPTPSVETIDVPVRSQSTLTPEMLEAQLRPRRLPWLMLFVGLGALAGVGLFLLGRPSPAPAHPTSVAALPLLPESPPPSNLVEPSDLPQAAAGAATLSAPLPSANAAPLPAPAAASAPVHAPAHGARVAPRATPHSAAAAPSPEPAASPAPSKKPPDAAAAWDTNSFGPRH